MEKGARVAALLVALLAAPLVALPPAAVAGPTHDPSTFEAAFQGRCGAGSPCEQLCRELHDGTYECGCKPGFLLNVDGYSCQELNSTFRTPDDLQNAEEDVLYQKDASFSAELDVALLQSNKKIKTQSMKADLYKVIEDNHIYNQKHIERQATTELPKYISNQDLEEYNYSYTGEKYKQMEGLNNLIADGISRKDINMITDDKTRIDEDSYTSEDFVRKGQVTTLGPSLDQKVPGATSSPPWTAAVGIEAAGQCGGGRCLCPLGRSGPQCEHETRIVSPRFSGGSWLALPALRGAYKRVRLRLRVRPERARGVLLLTGERDDLSGDYLALLLRDGHVELRYGSRSYYPSTGAWSTTQRGYEYGYRSNQT